MPKKYGTVWLHRSWVSNWNQDLTGKVDTAEHQHCVKNYDMTRPRNLFPFPRLVPTQALPGVNLPFTLVPSWVKWWDHVESVVTHTWGSWGFSRSGSLQNSWRFWCTKQRRHHSNHSPLRMLKPSEMAICDISPIFRQSQSRHSRYALRLWGLWLSNACRDVLT
jgi:hypothetical protein